MRIGVLGGSFDPVHHGHLIAAQALREALGLDEVRLIPTCHQPLKPMGHAAPAADRAAMVGLAVAGTPGLAGDPIEVERGGTSYTVDTLRALHVREPGVRWCLLLGSDAAGRLSEWREADAIPGLAEVITFDRTGQAAPGAVSVPAIAISSTAIRARARGGLSLRYWVPDGVAEYIASHRLYLHPPSR